MHICTSPAVMKLSTAAITGRFAGRHVKNSPFLVLGSRRLLLFFLPSHTSIKVLVTPKKVILLLP